MPQRLAVIAVTRGGREIAGRIAAATAAELHLARRTAEPADVAVVFDPPLRNHMGRLWAGFDGLIFVLATGAVVRLIAPHLADKHADPAVVAVDEAGKFAVSVLSGHTGGADELCARVAAALGGQAVITGASAAVGAPAFDVLARRHDWAIETPEALTAVAAAVVNGETVVVEQDSGDAAWQADIGPAKIVFAPAAECAKHGAAAAVVISDRVSAEPAPAVPTLRLRPRTLHLGIGCERGTSTAVIRRAATTALAEAGLSRLSVAGLASIDLKRDEPGLLAFSGELGAPVRWFTAQELSAVAGRVPNPSAAVNDAVGTPGVAEPAALLSAGAETLLVEKRVFRVPGEPGAATIAIAREGAGGRRGAVVLIGLGPGAPEQMTPAAKAALSRAEIVIGFDAYIAAARPAIPPQAEIVALPIGAELERARIAVERAAAGKNVAVVSSGDVGVFGMAGPVYEEWATLPAGRRPEIETVPGITAAQAAAALLGAPLMHDFACISLSDRLTPRDVIETRLRAAASADLLTALYNPAARERAELLGRAAAIFREHRPATTPVGIVRDAFRPGQSVRIACLADLPAGDVDMHTVVIIGNSQTRAVAGRMITPRGYPRR